MEEKTIYETGNLKRCFVDGFKFQLNFLWEESLSPESYYGKQLQREGFYENKSPSRCAYLFHKIVERSSDSYQSISNTRCKSAEKWYDKLKGTYKLTDSTGCATGSIEGDPNFGNTDAWLTKIHMHKQDYMDSVHGLLGVGFMKSMDLALVLLEMDIHV